VSGTSTETPGERLLTFEVADVVYALPIAEVLEVAEAARVTCIPTLPTAVGGVMNWHGEAIPVIASHLLLGPEGAEAPVPDEAATDDRHVLVVSDRPEESARMGLTVDRIHGLINAPRGVAGAGVVTERRPLDGRVVNVLDPLCLVGRAEEVIRRSAE